MTENHTAPHSVWDDLDQLSADLIAKAEGHEAAIERHFQDRIAEDDRLLTAPYTDMVETAVAGWWQDYLDKGAAADLSGPTL